MDELVNYKSLKMKNCRTKKEKITNHDAQTNRK